MPISYRAAQNLIKRGNEEELRVALAGGLDPNLTNENGWTLLMLAAVEGSLPLAQMLLESKADVSRTNTKGESAQSIAAKRGHEHLSALFRAT